MTSKLLFKLYSYNVIGWAIAGGCANGFEAYDKCFVKQPRASYANLVTLPVQGIFDGFGFGVFSPIFFGGVIVNLYRWK